MIETSSFARFGGLFTSANWRYPVLPKGVDMTLTAKQEAFAQAIADGKTQADAYRAAYNAAKMKPETIWSKASTLMADGKVTERVTSLKAVTASKALWTRERSVIALASIADGAEAKASEITAAIKELNLMHGFNAPAKVEFTGAFSVIERRIVHPGH